MEIKTPDSEKIEEIKAEIYPEKAPEAEAAAEPETEAVAEVTTESEAANEVEPEEIEWVSIKKHNGEVDEEQSDSVPEPEIMPEAIEEPSIEVVSEEDIKPVEVVEDIAPSSKELAKKAKDTRREARREVKESEVDREDDGSIFKTKGFRKLWDRICLVLLILAIGLPICLLAYIIFYFFI